MSPEEWEQVKEIFLTALELDPEGIPSFLSSACRENETVRAEVEKLLAHHKQAGSFLDKPAVDKIQDTGDLDYLLEHRLFSPNELVLNRFRINRLLGSGGMGQALFRFRRPYGAQSKK